MATPVGSNDVVGTHVAAPVFAWTESYNSVGRVVSWRGHRPASHPSITNASPESTSPPPPPPPPARPVVSSTYSDIVCSQDSMVNPIGDFNNNDPPEYSALQKHHPPTPRPHTHSHFARDHGHGAHDAHMECCVFSWARSISHQTRTYERTSGGTASVARISRSKSWGSAAPPSDLKWDGNGLETRPAMCTAHTYVSTVGNAHALLHTTAE